MLIGIMPHSSGKVLRTPLRGAVYPVPGQMRRYAGGRMTAEVRPQVRLANQLGSFSLELISLYRNAI